MTRRLRAWRGRLLPIGRRHDPYVDNRNARRLRDLQPGPDASSNRWARRLDAPKVAGRARVRTAGDRFLSAPRG